MSKKNGEIFYEVDGVGDGWNINRIDRSTSPCACDRIGRVSDHGLAEFVAEACNEHDEAHREIAALKAELERIKISRDDWKQCAKMQGAAYRRMEACVHRIAIDANPCTGDAAGKYKQWAEEALSAEDSAE